MSRAWVAGLAAAALFAGCAKPQTTVDISMSPTVEIEVLNNYSPPVQVTVFIVGSYGGRQVLGTVSTGRTQKFSYQPTTASDKFTLIAQAASGALITSNAFSLVNLQTVSWDMESNLIKFYEQ